MRQLTTALFCALLLPACLTAGVWNWAGETHPATPRPIRCGVDADGATVILVAVDGGDQPSFCLRVPLDWRVRTQVPVGETGESIHSPLYLAREPVPAGALDALEPAPEEWFLRHEPGTGSVDILVEDGGGHVVVGTAELPSEAHWGKRLTATVLTPATVALDAVAIVGSFFFFLWLDTELPWPWGNDSEDEHEGDYSSDPSESTPELIFPARGPS